MTPRSKIRRLLIGAASLTSTAVVLIPGGAASASGDQDVRSPGRCSGATTSEIKAGPDDGRMEVEFEVDQNRSGERWRVKLLRNGDVFFRGVRQTAGRSGSFSVEQRTVNGPGDDRFKGVARHIGSDERCVATVSR